MLRPTPQISSRPISLRAAGWMSLHQKDQNAFHSRGMSASVKPACSRGSSTRGRARSRGRSAAHTAPDACLLVEQRHPGPVRLDQTGRKVADSIRKVHEPIVEGPLRDVVVQAEPEGEVGRLSGLQRRNERVGQLIFPIKRKLNLLAAPLLEGGDDLPQRRVLLRVGAFATTTRSAAFAPIGAQTRAAAKTVGRSQCMTAHSARIC